MTGYKIIRQLDLNGCSPQKAIRMMNDIINRTPIDMRRYLVIEEYGEDYGHPFREPDKCLRVVLKENS